MNPGIIPTFPTQNVHIHYYSSLLPTNRSIIQMNMHSQTLNGLHAYTSPFYDPVSVSVSHICLFFAVNMYKYTKKLCKGEKRHLRYKIHNKYTKKVNKQNTRNNEKML